MTLGQRIQGERLRLGLSQEGLGEKVGVSRQAVSRWESDGAVPDTDKLIALSRLFGVTLNELLQVEGPPLPSAGEAETPVTPERPPAPRKGRTAALGALCLLLAAALSVSLAVLAHRGRQLEALERRVAELETDLAMAGETMVGETVDPAALLAGWELRVRESPRGITVQVLTTRTDEDLEVFFQVAGGPLSAVRTEARAEPGASGVYTGDLTLPGNGGTLFVGFRLDGTEHLLPLARDLTVSGESATWEPLWPETD